LRANKKVKVGDENLTFTKIVNSQNTKQFDKFVNNLQVQPKSPKKLNKNSDSEEDGDDEEMDDNGELTPTKNLIGRLKTARLKVLEESLTEEQKITEKE
jgi:hypothetical protein